MVCGMRAMLVQFKITVMTMMIFGMRHQFKQQHLQIPAEDIDLIKEMEGVSR